MNTTTAARSRIVLTARARTSMAALLAEADPGTRLRIVAQGGGCGGMRYGFMLDDNLESADLEVAEHGVSIVIDAMSYQRMRGATIDCIPGPQGDQFVIDNPNADAGACGCGSACASGAG